MEESNSPQPAIELTMAQNRSPLRAVLAVGIILIMLAGITWGIRSSFRDNPAGGDFYTYWAAAHFQLLGLSPYSEEVSENIHISVFRHTLEEDEDLRTFAYPEFVLFPLFPLALLDVQTALALFMALHIVLLITIGFFFTQPHPRWMDISLLFFYPIDLGLILGNVSLSIGVILLAYYGWVVCKDSPSRSIQILLGIALAWAAGKPQVVWLILPLALALALLRKLWPLLASFLAGLGAMVAASFIILPGWMGDWISRMVEYSSYKAAGVVLSGFLAQWISSPSIANGVTISVVSLLLLTAGIIIASRLRRSAPKESPHKPPALANLDRQFMLWLFALACLVTYLVRPGDFSYDQSIFIATLFAWSVVSWKKERKSVLWFWWIGLLVSWAAFFLKLWLAMPLVVSGLPILYYCTWIGYMAIKEIKKTRLLHLGQAVAPLSTE